MEMGENKFVSSKVFAFLSLLLKISSIHEHLFYLTDDYVFDGCVSQFVLKWKSFFRIFFIFFLVLVNLRVIRVNGFWDCFSVIWKRFFTILFVGPKKKMFIKNVALSCCVCICHYTNICSCCCRRQNMFVFFNVLKLLNFLVSFSCLTNQQLRG